MTTGNEFHAGPWDISLRYLNDYKDLSVNIIKR